MNNTPTPTPTPFGQWLKQRRKVLDLTQEELAQLIGASFNAVRKMESGERRPSRQIAQLLAEALGVPTDERTVFVYFARTTSNSNQLGPPGNDNDTGTSPSPWRIHNRQHSNLPMPPASLIGREREVETALGQLLRDRTRLLTLVGPPGVGKTRLAMEVATEAMEHFEDGVFFIELAPISDPSLVIATIGRVLGVKEVANQPLIQPLKEYLSDKRVLLVLDNFEQVVGAAVEVAELLSACPWLKALATSRALLQVRGERQFSVPPLEVPDLTNLPAVDKLSTYSAVELFLERAQDIDTQFELEEENALDLATICARLDGLPLAIELAAARINMLSPKEILMRLDSRLKLLAGGLRDLPARQQALRTAIEWSYDLLDEREQSLFKRLGVFVGGCTLGAVEAVGNADGDNNGRVRADVLEGMRSLVSKNLLQQWDGSDGLGEPRFTMLETIKEFAFECLQEGGESDEMQQKHALFFLAMLNRLELTYHGPSQIETLKQVVAEFDNLRAAMRLFEQTGQVEASLRMVWLSFWYWDIFNYFTEGRKWVEASLARYEAYKGTEAYAKVQCADGLLAYNQGDYATARSYFEKSIVTLRELDAREALSHSLIGLGAVFLLQGEEAARSVVTESVALCRELNNTWTLSLALLILGHTALKAGNVMEANSLYVESLTISREKGDRLFITYPLSSLGGLAWVGGYYERARVLLEEVLTICREFDARGFITTSLNTLAEVARNQGDIERSKSLTEEALALCKRSGNSAGIAWSLYNLAHVARCEGDWVRAAALFKEGLNLRMDQGDMQRIPLCLAGLAEVASLQGQTERSAKLSGTLDLLFTKSHTRWSPADKADYEQAKSTARGKLGDADWEAAWQAGKTMGIEQAIAYGLEES